MTRFFLRPARQEDARMLTELAMRSKAHWGYDAAFMKACEAELTITPERIVQEEVTVAVSGDAGIGMVSLAKTQTPGLLELEDMFVEPAAIGSGIGACLMDHAKERARESGATRVEVDADPNAQGFYERCGYRLIGTSPSASIEGRKLPRLAIDL